MMTGSKVKLSDNELKANEVIMNLKNEILNNGFADPGIFNVSKHFFTYKDTVKDTELYKIIKAMPKGAVLHAHDTGILSPDYVLGLTYLEDLYVCFQSDFPLFKFSYRRPHDSCETKWQLMKEARFSSGNVQKFDANLRKHFTIVVDNPNEVYTDVNKVWKCFQNYFISTSGLFGYNLVWERYFYDTLKALHDDNVMYVEIRSVLPPLYDLDGSEFDSIDTAIVYNEVTETFKKDYPDFYGAKLIFAPLKQVNLETLKEYLETAKEIKRKLPNFFAGFDLVGQEDLGRPLKDFLPELEEEMDELDYFFHAGETNWNGISDENLFDAIALKTKRIGHAFALVKHPLLLNEVKNKGIAVEVNVLSNSVLKLVEDVRNHPLATFLAQDLPVVLSSDDPGVWEADPLSHDFYVTFVGVANKHADLKMLKQLALNSILYSAECDKNKMLYEFEIKWTKFIDNIVRKERTIDTDDSTESLAD
ncbi:adenosine/AMP deaminase domain-containing protein [Phthorimaea operculella]|nr:adenosine/AMP deaminase domain-containing protein [Phthorimaea operculella]